MAYRDMNGKVMIDEAAAQADIRQERQAEQILRRAANALQAVQNESNSFQGETAAAIGERAEQLRRQILNLISDLEDPELHPARRPPLLAAGPEMEADLREFAVREGGV